MHTQTIISQSKISNSLHGPDNGASTVSVTFCQAIQVTRASLVSKYQCEGGDTRISFRLPDGTKLFHSFMNSSATQV